MKRKGFMQQTALFGILMMTMVIFVMIIAADAPSELQNIFTLLKKAGYVGLGLIPVVGIYLIVKEFS